MPLSLKPIREDYPYPKMDIEQYFVDGEGNQVKAGYISGLELVRHENP